MAADSIPSHWSTASGGDSTDTSPMELSVLGEHVLQCRGLPGRLTALHCGAQRMLGFCSARLVSSLLVLSLLAAALWWR